MAEISASLVKQLREITGLGMMDCKRALGEAGGDLIKAEGILRIKSGAKASKAADRIAAEGVIGAWLAPDAKLGALVELNCETDFVAKNDDFLRFAHELAEAVAIANPTDVQAVGTLTAGAVTADERRRNLVQKIGENITIRRFARIQSAAKISRYVHSNNKTGVLIEYDGGDDIGRGVAMHVAFYRPAYLSKTEVPSEVVMREREILEARARGSGKSAEIAAKMIEGGLSKYLGEITLLGQPFVMDDKQTVAKMLAANNGKVLGYRYLLVGEGIQKKTGDFAAEVKAAAGVGF